AGDRANDESTGTAPLEIQNTHEHMVTPTPNSATPDSDASPAAEPAVPEDLPQPAQEPRPGPFAPPPVPKALAPHSVDARPGAVAAKTDGRERCEFVAESLYPSAFTCAECHQQIFD